MSFAAGRWPRRVPNAIRPTTDRTREALFNVLAHRYAGKLAGGRVLDLFAGTGALGLEALSRGASYGVFIEESAEGRGLIRGNVEAFGLTGRTKIFRRDATNLGEAGTMQAFDLVFADPPYGRGLGELALQQRQGRWLAGRRSALCGRGSCVGKLQYWSGFCGRRRAQLWRHRYPFHRKRLNPALFGGRSDSRITNNSLA